MTGDVARFDSDDYQVCDYSDFLERKYDMRSAKNSRWNRPSYEESKASIKIADFYYDQILEFRDSGENFYEEEWFIIIDDVTTTGNIMRVCKDILIESGADPKQIITLAIAKTM